ncbi:Aldedh domain-containing protein [Mycena sanguinolenta]|uniref:Aldedh domain-containing protein n=1 Tax=Mycena sanguinolenta TaxID=230812 RepID=A0A8H6X4P7_9AGAR|nr:Aldedh domain-containing protein [Mycena sanguinolenta]
MHTHSTRKFFSLGFLSPNQARPLAMNPSPAPPQMASTALVRDDSERQQPSSPLLRKEFPSRASWRNFLRAEVDPDHATGPLAVFCFMTGFIDAISFTSVFVWCGFQTGNFAQLALAFARTYNTEGIVISISDVQALVSLLAFNVGAFLGRFGDRMGAHSRGWLASGTAIQAALTLVAGICIQQSGQDSIAAVRGEPSWTNGFTFAGLALMAASLGLQGTMAKRLNTHFSTTVVLTAVWIELMADPQLFYRRNIASRDHKVIALGSLFCGAVAARLLTGYVGAAAVLGFGAGIRLFVAAGWCFVRGKGDGYTHLLDHEPEDAAETDVVAEVPDYGTLPRGTLEGRWW